MSAKRCIREWLEKLRPRRSNIAAISHSLAVDLGVQPKATYRILHQTMHELYELAAKDDAVDARPVINKAINELARHGDHWHPSEEAMMERCLGELPERDFTTLCYFKQGKKHREIAALMGTDVESVRRSLVKTYTDLRMKMMNTGGDGAGEPLEAPQSEPPDARGLASH